MLNFLSRKRVNLTLSGLELSIKSSNRMLEVVPGHLVRLNQVSNIDLRKTWYGGWKITTTPAVAQKSSWWR